MERLFLTLCCCALLSASCELMTSTPYEPRATERHEGLTQKNLDAITARPAPERIRFAITTDVQQEYEVAPEFVDAINARDDIDFVVVPGDLTHYGLNREYNDFADIFDELEVPYLTVIGNHDMLGHGEFTYRKIFGDLNYVMDWGGYRLIFFDSVGLHFEDNGLDFDWLEAQVTGDDFEHSVLIAHVPPRSSFLGVSEEATPARIAQWNRALALDDRLMVSLHGHKHSFQVQEEIGGDIENVVASETGAREYLLVTLEDGGYSYERVDF